MKKLGSVLLVIFFALTITFSKAEENRHTLTINLETATDGELADALAQILAEQRARLKTKIQLDFTEVTLLKGAVQKITAEVVDLQDTVTAGKLNWRSSDESVATCNNGIVKCVGAGTAVITCSSTLSDGTEIFAEVGIIGLMPVQSLKLTGNKLEVMAGDIFTPEVIIMPDNASNKDVTFASSDEKIVRVNENGELVAVLAGKATITVVLLF